jgi:Zn-dependent peptidase ImmA (M78 family)
MRDYLLEIGHERLPFVGAVRLGDDIGSVAEAMRQTLNLGGGWASRIATWTEAVGLLRDAAESADILVVINGVVGNDTHRKLDPEEFRGFVLADDHAPLVFINNADARSAQMFTLAHELAHLWIAEDGIFDLPDLQPAHERREIFCNRVAAEFLVPAAELRAFWADARRQSEPFQAVARRFKVSPLVAARRALDLELITRDAFLKFYRAYETDERRQQKRSSGGNFYNNQNSRVGKRFARAVALAAKEGRLLYRDAYNLTGLHGATFDKYARSQGVDL